MPEHAEEVPRPAGDASPTLQDVLDADRTVGFSLDGRATPTPPTTATTPPTPQGAADEITARISDELKEALKQKMEGAGLFESEEDEPLHHHGDGKSPAFITAFASGLVNFLLMFGMSCAYGIIIFSDEHNRRHVPLAIKMNLSSALIIGLLCAAFSKVPVAIGGPDINPAVFLGLFVEKIAKAIADDVGLGYPSDAKRRLGEIASSSFCQGEHEQLYLDECQQYHERVIATTIFATAVSTFLLGVVFLLLGTLKFTRYMAYVPTSIVEAFLACVGYKVFAEAVKQCNYEATQFVPAGIIGISLYFLKAKHVGNPAIVMPLGFLLPLSAFFAGVYAFGADVDEVRKDGLMFEEITNVDFWEVWKQSIDKPDNVSIDAWAKTLPDLVTMLVVVCLDCVLKVVATETKIPLHVDKDYEVRMHGINNILNTATGSTVGYMQLKFNVINYGITRSITDRRASFIYALLCAICYIYTLEPFNYLPRFFISSLLFFAGSGFVAENLWGSRGTTSVLEWLEILVIVLTFILTKSLVIAVILGGFLTFVIFIAKYAKISVMDGGPSRGGDMRVVERMGPLMMRNIRHVIDNWLMVVRLKGYIFFASANSLTSHVDDYIKEQESMNLPDYRRLKYIVFDCSLLDGMDASAAKAMKRLVTSAGRLSVRVLWTHLTPALASELRFRGLLAASRDIFNDIDEVVMQVEHHAKSYLHGIEDKWLSLHPAFGKFAQMTLAQFRFEPFTQVLLSPLYRIGCPWRYCSTVQLHGHSTLLFSPGDSSGYLYLVHSGAVALFREIPEPGEEWDSPVAIYRQGWFLNRETLMRAPSRYYGVAIEDGEILCWSQDQWWRMACELPLMTSEMLKTVMKQQARDTDTYDASAHGTMPAPFADDAVWDFVHEDLFQRQEDMQRQDSIGGMSRKISGGSGLGLERNSIPEEIQVRLTAIETAQCLESYGFYSAMDDDKDMETFRPDLPQKLKDDIETAFRTFTRGKLHHRDAKVDTNLIDPDDVPSALMYAGLFHCPEAHDPHCKPTTPMDHNEFLEICHRGLMASFTEKQLQTINMLFGLPADRPVSAEEKSKLTLTAAGLQKSLRKMIPGLTPEMADAFFVAWRGSDLSIPLGLQAFTGIMSLLVRLHEPYWHLMQGLKAIIGVDRICSGLTVQCSDIVVRKQGPAELTTQEAEEMLWSSDWRFCGRGEGQTLGWPEMVSAITTCMRRETGALPAPCVGATMLDEELNAIVSSPSCIELSKTLPVSAPSKSNGLGFTSAPTRRHSDKSTELRRDISGKSAGSGKAQKPHREASRSRVGQACQRFRGWLANKVPAIKACTIDAAVAALIAASTLSLVLEPMISGEDDEQSVEEERVWLIVEICITSFLTVEWLIRCVTADFDALRNGHLVGTLVLDFLAVIPLALDGIAEPLSDGMIKDGVKDAAALLRVIRFARVHLFSPKSTLAAPVATMMVVVWGIYVKHGFTGGKK